jgi:hypothetical protein
MALLSSRIGNQKPPESCGRNKPNNDHVTLVDVTGLIIYFSIALVIMRGAML